VNTLAAAAFFMLFVLLFLTVFADLSTAATSLITFLLGRFAGYVDQVYSFEFSTSRTNKEKDATIKALAETAAPNTEALTAALAANTEVTAANSAAQPVKE
jgi:hypothetical protein